MSMHDVIFCGLLGLALGFGAGYLRWGNPPIPSRLERLTEGDIREVLAKLRPLTRRGWPTDLSIYAWGDGEIQIHAKLIDGMEVRGQGDTLSEATAKICRQCEDVRDALEAEEPAGRKFTVVN